MPEAKIILDVCGGTGSWSAPYRKSGYDVRIVDPADDIQAEYAMTVSKLLRLYRRKPFPVYGMLLAPPCTHFAVSGARWWDIKDWLGMTDESVQVVKDCMQLVRLCKPKFWALENPVGRLPDYIGPYKMTFQPCDYGDIYTKRTCLWGEFNPPRKRQVEPLLGSKMHTQYGGASTRTKRMRSVTPIGFAKAFYRANR